jgi:hypothetical protein
MVSLVAARDYLAATILSNSAVLRVFNPVTISSKATGSSAFSAYLAAFSILFTLDLF